MYNLEKSIKPTYEEQNTTTYVNAVKMEGLVDKCVSTAIQKWEGSRGFDNINFYLLISTMASS